MMKIKNNIDFEDLAEVIKVLGHPVRLKIVCGLISKQSCVTDIYTCLEMPQATISQHLSLLKSKGVVKSERDGTKRRYYVADVNVKKIVKALLS